MKINDQRNYFVEGLHKNIDFKDKKYFNVPEYFFDKWQLYNEVESCINHNIKDNSLLNKIFVLKCLSTIYFDYKRNEELMYQEKNFEIIEVCNFLIRKIDKKMDELQTLLQLEKSKVDISSLSEDFNRKFDFYLEPFQNRFIGTSYHNLRSYLYDYFTTGSFPANMEVINLSVSNIKSFAWTLNLLYKDFNVKNERLSFDYLQFAKQYISIFQNVKFNNVNYGQSLLYRYFTSGESALNKTSKRD